MSKKTTRKKATAKKAAIAQGQKDAPGPLRFARDFDWVDNEGKLVRSKKGADIPDECAQIARECGVVAE